MQDGSVECWIGRDDDPHFRGAAYSDFWRVSPDGFAFLLRGYQEDSPDTARQQGVEPGRAFDIVNPIWRVGEALLHAERLAANLSGEGVTVAFRAGYEGLRDRHLGGFFDDRRFWGWQGDRISHQPNITLDILAPVQSISPNLVEVVHSLLEPLYALFGFFKMPVNVVQEELVKLRSRGL